MWAKGVKLPASFRCTRLRFRMRQACMDGFQMVAIERVVDSRCCCLEHGALVQRDLLKKGKENQVDETIAKLHFLALCGELTPVRRLLVTKESSIFNARKSTSFQILYIVSWKDPSRSEFQRILEEQGRMDHNF